MKSMKAALMTHRGAVRKENQDAVFVPGTVRAGDMDVPEFCDLGSRERPILLAVIDGMGGREGGALAAKIMADTFAEELEGKDVFGARLHLDEDERALRRLLTEAAGKMRAEALKNPLLTEMGATVSGLLLREKSALAFNCGDCRAYRFSGGYLERVTRDHSIVQALLEAEKIDEEEMRTHPQKNIVTSAVSADTCGEFDLFVKGLSLSEGDSFFLCSDGVWEALSHQELTALIARGAPSPEAARGLFDALLAAECRDNVSFIWAGSSAAPGIPRED